MLGTLDLKAALTDGETHFRPGLLAAAHGGVLYVDEVNLLPDHLVDVLLDVATSGINRVERDGVSHSHAARFVLVGSMNPEEGELRPQLLDRFGLSVVIAAPTDPVRRAEIVRRRLTHDAGGEVIGTEGDMVLRARLAASMPADLPDTVVDLACRVALSVGAEGLRADLVLCRAAAAFAGWEGRSVASAGDVERVAGLALGHRRRRRPFDPPTLSHDELERALAAARQSFAEAYPPPPVPEPTTEDADADEPADAGADPLADVASGADGGPAPDDAAAGVNGNGEGVTDEASEAADGDAAAGLDPAAHQAQTDTGEPGTDDAGDAGDSDDPAGGDAPGSRPVHDPALAELEAEIAAEGARIASPDDPGTTRVPDPAGDPADEGAPGPSTAPTGSWYDLAGGAFDTGPSPVQLAEPAAPVIGSPPLPGPRGRIVGDEPVGSGSSGVALAATVRAAAQRRQGDPDAPVVTADDLRAPVRSRTVGRTVVIAVDASGSMGTYRRVEAATGAVLGLLADAYLRRDRVAMVTFRSDTADVVLPPTASVELARARLAELPTGGVTPLAEGISAGLALARRAADDGWPPLLVLITDGRATGNQSARERSLAAAADVASAGVQVIVVDAEDGPNRLGLAAELADAMGARHLQLDELTPSSVENVVREALRGPA